MYQFYLKSFGCKVNQYDGQGLRERLVEAGLRETPLPEEADLVVLSFCVVTGRSASRCLRALKSLCRKRPGARFLLAGAEWVVESSNPCSATVRCLGGRQIGTRHVEFGDGRHHDFPVYARGQRPGQRLTICPQAFVERL